MNRKIKQNKIEYKFLLICTGKLRDNLIEFLLKDQNKIFQNIVDNILIYCEDKKRYKNIKKNYNFVVNIVENQKSLGEYIKKFKENSKSYKTFPIINYTLYSEKHNVIHKEIAKYYGKVAYTYENAISIFRNFLNEFQDELEIVTNDKSKDGKKRALIKALEVFSTGNKKKKIKKYTEENDSYYQDFNRWLNNINKRAISKIAYFVSSLMYSLNKINKGVEEEIVLYRGICIEFSYIVKYYMNYIKEDNIITFPSFTSTSKKKEKAKFFIDLHKKENNFGVLFKINYNYKNIWKYLAVNIIDISFDPNEAECLILPFTFYKIKDFKFIKDNGNIDVEIELDCIFKKEILEKNLNKRNNIIYNINNNIMELDNNNIIIEEQEEEEFLIDDNENSEKKIVSLIW